MKSTEKINQRDSLQVIVDSECKVFTDIAEKVLSEMTTLLNSLSTKEMTRTEVKTIAERLIQYQTEENTSESKTHEVN